MQADAAPSEEIREPVPPHSTLKARQPVCVPQHPRSTTSPFNLTRAMTEGGCWAPSSWAWPNARRWTPSATVRRVINHGAIACVEARSARPVRG